MSAARLLLTPGELALLAARLGLPLPAGFAVTGGSGSVDRLAEVRVIADGEVAAAVAAGLAAACAPAIGVHVRAAIGSQEVTAVLGIRGAAGGTLARIGTGPVEASLWPATDLPTELARVVPPVGGSPRPALHRPLSVLTAPSQDPEVETLRASVSGSLQATVVSPPEVVGQVVWLATTDGWQWLEPAETVGRERWATVRSVDSARLGEAVASLVAAALT